MGLRTNRVQWQYKEKGVLKILKLTPRLKNKSWNNQKSENHKKSQDSRLIRSQTRHKNPEYTF
jgi:hypothetical protein